MKPKPHYEEGDIALENFEQGMNALFKVPKAAVVKREKTKQRKRLSVHKKKRHDKD